MMQNVAAVLLLSLAICESKPSEGINPSGFSISATPPPTEAPFPIHAGWHEPPKPAIINPPPLNYVPPPASTPESIPPPLPSENNGPPPASSTTWEPHEPSQNYVPPAPVKAIERSESEEDLAPAGQIQTEKPPTVVASVVSRIVPPVAPPLIFVSSQPTPDRRIEINQKHQSEYKSTYNVTTTFHSLPPTFIVPHPIEFHVPQIPRFPQNHAPVQVATPISTPPVWNLPPQRFSFATCTPPRHVLNLNWDSPAFTNRESEVFYKPLSHSEMTSNFVQATTRGNKVSQGQSAADEDLCMTTSLNWNDLTSVVTTRGSDKEEFAFHFQCRLLNGQQKFALECNPGDPTDESFRTYFTKSDNKSYLVGYHCWEGGRLEWFTFTNSYEQLPAYLKREILQHIETLGFNSNQYKETDYQRCLPDQLKKPGFETQKPPQSEEEVEVETEAVGSATALFPKCSPPSSFLRRYTWESSSNHEGIEFFDVIMAHPRVAEIYRQSLDQNVNINSYYSPRGPNCLRLRLNYGTNSSQHLGHGDSVSNDFSCSYAANQEWILECISKSSPALSYRNYGIKSDNLSWILTYQCLNSGAIPASWTLWVAPGTTLSDKTKDGILHTVESLGFNPREFVEFDSERCTYRHKARVQSCSCCAEEDARYF